MITNMTEEAKRTRIVQNWKENAFVEAGAGAGKTTLIVKRVVEQLKGGMRPEQLVIITFTNMAAEELRSRITAAVQKEGLASDGFDMDLMQISTIHSFCFKLLRERTFDAKLPIDVTLLENQENGERIEAAFEKWLESLKGADWDKLTVICDKRSTSVKYIKKLYEQIVPQTSDTQIGYVSTISDDAEYYAKCDRIIDAFQKALIAEAGNLDGKSHTDLSDFPKGKLSKKGKIILELLQNPENAKDEIVSEIVKPCGNKKEFLGGKSESAAIIDARLVAVYRQTYKEEADSVYFEQTARLYKPLLDYAIAAADFYRSKEAENRQEVNNNRLIELTRDLIVNSREARTYFAEQYKCIYVDEFQDTDHVQEELIWRLASEVDDGNVLRPGALFLVGDPKQSIYRFRGAEPQVYYDTKDKVCQLHNASVYELSDNYRSNASIISWVNETFCRKPEMVAGGNYIPMNCKKPLATDGKIADQNGKTIETQVLAGVYQYQSPDTVTEGASQELDIAAAIALIQGMMEGNYAITDYEYDRAGNPIAKARKIRYSDFLLLCTNMTHMKEYFEALEAQGIPVNMTGKDKLIQEDAVRTYLALYGYLANTKSSRAKVAAIEAMRHNMLIDKESEADSFGKAILKKLKVETAQMSAYGIANYLAGELPLLLSVDVNHQKDLVNLIRGKLYQMIEGIEAKGGLTKHAFYQELRSIATGEIERILSLEEQPNAVRFMNLHKAKGLEGNIVIYLDRTENRSFRENGVKIETVYYPTIKDHWKHKIWCSYEGNQKIYSQAVEDDRAERIRLEYVAATRAKQVLIIMDCLNESALFTDDYRLADCPSVKDIVQTSGKTHSDAETAAELELVRLESPEDAAELYKKCKPSNYEQTSQIGSNAREAFTGTISAAEAHRPKGDEVGNVMHRALELFVERRESAPVKVDLAAVCTRQAIDENIDGLKSEDVDPAICQNFVEQVVNAFADWTAQTGLFEAAQNIYTELPFSYYEQAASFDTGSVWMKGNADLVLQQHDGSILVIDYKSDYDTYMTEEETVASLKAKYTGQLQMYRHSMAKIFGVPEENVALKILSFSYKWGDKPEERMRVRETEVCIFL